MRTDVFRSIARQVAADPLTESQIRELTGADQDAWQAALRRAAALVEHLACWRCDCVYADVLADPADVRVLWDRYSWGALGQAELLVVRLDIPEGLSVRNTRHAVPMSDVRRMAAAMGAYPGEEVMDWREVWR